MSAEWRAVKCRIIYDQIFKVAANLEPWFFMTKINLHKKFTGFKLSPQNVLSFLSSPICSFWFETKKDTDFKFGFLLPKKLWLCENFHTGTTLRGRQTLLGQKVLLPCWKMSLRKFALCRLLPLRAFWSILTAHLFFVRISF